MPLPQIFPHPSVWSPGMSIAEGCGDFDDFFKSTASAVTGSSNYLTANGAGTGSYALVAGHGGVARVESGATADNTTAFGDQADNLTNAMSRTTFFAARFLVEDADEDAFFIGLAKLAGLTNRNVLAKTFVAAGTFEGMGFYADHAAAGSPVLKYAVGTGSAVNAGSTGLIMADGTYMNVGIVCTDAKKVELYAGTDNNINRVALIENTSVATYIPTASPLGRVAQVKTLDTGADYLQVDAWISGSHRA